MSHDHFAPIFLKNFGCVGFLKIVSGINNETAFITLFILKQTILCSLVLSSAGSTAFDGPSGISISHFLILYFQSFPKLFYL